MTATEIIIRFDDEDIASMQTPVVVITLMMSLATTTTSSLCATTQGAKFVIEHWTSLV